jgi:ABC-type Fe3+/spermidine/putrescine transport system ATPase subunit
VVLIDDGPTVRADVIGFSPGDRCHAVVRPEKLRIASVDTAGNGGLPTVDGVVESSLYLGTSTQIAVLLPNRARMTVLVPNADEAERQRLPGGGARVKLSWHPDHMHLVRDSETELISDRELDLARSEGEEA